MRAILAAILALTPTIATSEHILGGADISNGEAVYAEACAACHGADLEGQPDWQTPGADGVMPAPPHDKAGHTWHHDSQLLFDYTKFGGQAALEARGVEGFTSGMPAFADTLSDADIRDVLGYIRSTWSDRVQAMQDMRSHQPGN
ncbi:c-type cytochrome [Maritimibacter dapengensis]|uniref:Cytochrome c n=1 Tax=Maritimibacter dapengensis TaxID=2836868 RepID=A0ABS6T376_9RHOB|nr:cytochrome c [Maritimibacter dapengensis]MBV7379677.1 cytochrome c [Maritimibacter dapengensis]